jgi:hypothetical protein
VKSPASLHFAVAGSTSRSTKTPLCPHAHEQCNPKVSPSLASNIACREAATQPVEAGSCVVATGKGRALKDAKPTDKSIKHLKHVINHWAHKNGYKVVKKVGKAHTTCAKKGPLSVCKSTAKVCG